MSDDYLWDRSGEPDPEVERLERVLGKYRYQDKPLGPAVNASLGDRRGGWIRLAAIAAAILIVLAGLWVFKLQNKTLPESHQANNTDTPEQKIQSQTTPLTPPTVAVVPHVIRATKSPGKIHHTKLVETPEDMLHGDSDVAAERQPLVNPFIDVETARHIERAQLLLRSFRNTRDGSPKPDPDIAYEKQQSRGLLARNILLRRDAEARGNIPAEDLLGSLEPFLLDIANLPDRPSRDDVLAIKERMHKKEIVSALQVYSTPTLSQVF